MKWCHMWTVHFHKRQAFLHLSKSAAWEKYVHMWITYVHNLLLFTLGLELPHVATYSSFARWYISHAQKQPADTQATFTYSSLIFRLIFHLLACACELHWAAQDNSKRTGEYERLWGCIFFNCSFANLLRHCHTRLKQESEECFYCTPGNVNELL